MREKYDVVIVGAGHSGLVAAFYLAQAGNSVLVLEKRDQVGGTCVTEEIFPGYFCSSVANASHSVDPRTIADMELEKHGLRYTVPELGSLTLFNSGEAFVPWPDREKRKAVVEKFAKSEKDVQGFYAVLNFFREVAEKMDISFYDDAPSFSEVAAKFVTPLEQQSFEKVMFGSIADILDEYLESEELKAFFAATAVATNTVGPYTPGGAYLLLQRPLWERSMELVGTNDRNDLMMKNSAPLGGIGSVTQSMARSAESVGAEFVLNTAVDEILITDGKASGVRLADGREVQAGIVLSNADPKLTFTRLVAEEHLSEDFREMVHAKKMKGSSAKVHLKMIGTPRFNAARDEAENELFLKTNFRIASSIENLTKAYNECVVGRWYEKVTVTGIIDSAIDPTMTPDGCHIMSLSVRGVPYHLESGTWEDQREALGKAVAASIGEHIGNLEEILDDIHVYTPEDLERNFGLVEGNGAHGDILPGGIFDSRPFPGYGNYRTPIEGLYLCGVGVWPGNFMSGVTGYNASQRILEAQRTRQTVGVEQ